MSDVWSHDPFLVAIRPTKNRFNSYKHSLVVVTGFPKRQLRGLGSTASKLILAIVHFTCFIFVKHHQEISNSLKKLWISFLELKIIGTTTKRQHFCFQRPLKLCRPLLTTLKNFGAQTKPILFPTTLCTLLIEIIWELF